MLTTIRFNASEIAALAGLNPYKKLEEAINDCWNRHARKRGYNAPKAPTFILEAYKVVDKNKEAVGTIMQDIKESANKTDTSKETETKTEALNAKIKEMKITKEEQETLMTYAKSKMFTNYGTRKEDKVHDIYKELTGETIHLDNKMHVKQIEDFEIGGKIDGQLDDGTVIEIKNRTRCLFNEVRQYENVQIQTYMQMLNQEKAHLVECYVNNEGKKLVNILYVDRDDDFWNDTVVPRLKRAKEIMDDMFETKKLPLIKKNE